MTTQYFEHEANGEICESDSHEARLKHLRRRIKAWVQAMLAVKQKRPIRFVGVRLSYRPDVSYNPRQITDMLRRVKQHAGDNLLGYAWVLELHASGRPHYHVCFALVPSYFLPHLDTLEYWRHGWTHTDTINHPSENYLGKYLGKKEQKRDEFPAGAHLGAFVVRCQVPPLQSFWLQITAAPKRVAEKMISLWHESGDDPHWLIAWRWVYIGGGDWLLRHKRQFWIVHSPWEYLGSEGFMASWRMQKIWDYRREKNVEAEIVALA